MHFPALGHGKRSGHLRQGLLLQIVTPWCLFAFLPSLWRKMVSARPFEAPRQQLLSYSGFVLIAECLLGVVFQHWVDEKCKQTPPETLFRISFLIEFWPSLEVSGRYHFPAQTHGIQSRSYSKTYFNSECFSYDFWVSVCLELSVWSCLFGVLTDTLDSKSSIFRLLCPRCLFGAVCLFVCMPVCWFGSRDNFPAQARGILNRHLRQGRVRSLRRCLLETIFLHRLGEY